MLQWNKNIQDKFSHLQLKFVQNPEQVIKYMDGPKAI
jgi:hypothetical protein